MFLLLRPREPFRVGQAYRHWHTGIGFAKMPARRRPEATGCQHVFSPESYGRRCERQAHYSPGGNRKLLQFPLPAGHGGRMPATLRAAGATFGCGLGNRLIQPDLKGERTVWERAEGNRFGQPPRAAAPHSAFDQARRVRLNLVGRIKGFPDKAGRVYPRRARRERNGPPNERSWLPSLPSFPREAIQQRRSDSPCFSISPP